MIFTLGVFSTIYGEGAEMTIGRALLISVVGFFLVFVILGLIALFVKAMGRGFDSAAAKRAAAPIPAPPVQNTAAPVSRPAGIPLPADTSQGELVLEDVSEADAAVIMAIVAHQSGVPLNRLAFHSIKLIKEDA